MDFLLITFILISVGQILTRFDIFWLALVFLKPILHTIGSQLSGRVSLEAALLGV